MAITISMINQKGGCGKTRSAIEFAACFSKLHYKVLLVDMDQQANASTYSNANIKAPGVYEAITQSIDPKTIIQKTPEYDILVGSEALSTVDAFFANDPRGVLRLKKITRALNDDYDFIILDTAPGRNLLMNMAYIASDFVVIPAEAKDGSVDGIKKVIVDVKNYNEDDLTRAQILGVVVTRCNEQTGLYKYEIERIQELLDAYLPGTFCMRVRESVAAGEAEAERQSMQLGKHSSNPAIDYREITEHILNQIV